MSITMIGVFISLAGTLLLKLGFSEVCSQEVITLAPAIVGGVIAWYGRYRMGTITVFGTRVSKSV